MWQKRLTFINGYWLQGFVCWRGCCSCCCCICCFRLLTFRVLIFYIERKRIEGTYPDHYRRMEILTCAIDRVGTVQNCCRPRITAFDRAITVNDTSYIGCWPRLEWVDTGICMIEIRDLHFVT